MTARTMSLDAAADIICGGQDDRDMKDPVRWLSDQIRAKRFPAVKIGRHWRMRPADVEQALEICSNTRRASSPTSTAAPSDQTGQVRQLTLTKTSERRRKASA